MSLNNDVDTPPRKTERTPLLGSGGGGGGGAAPRATFTRYEEGHSVISEGDSLFAAAAAAHGGGTGAATRTPALFSWDGVSYAVNVSSGVPLVNRKTERKQITHDIFGVVRPGECLAIMGPSGSGKTTTLDVLAGRKVDTALLAGDIRINGERPGATFKRVMGYVTQHECLIASQTVREALRYTAKLRLPLATTDEEREMRVEHVIREMKLSKVADSKIGNAEIRGVSGGERRRVAIANELVSNPSLLFLDEPTSGLDAKAALDVISALRSLATNGRRSIVFTIHQPRSALFKMFDKLLLLAAGRMVWFGDALAGLTFLEQCGYKMKPNRNPADFLLDTVATDVGEVRRLSEAYLASRTAKEVRATLAEISAGQLLEMPPSLLFITDERGKRVPTVSEYATPFWYQIAVLWRRESLSNLRNPGLYWAQLFQSVVLSIIVGTLWGHGGPSTALSALFFVSVYLGLLCFNSAPFLILFRSIFHHERASGAYRTSSYLISKVLADLPFVVGIATAFSSIIYGFIGLRSWPFYTLMCIVNILCGTSMVMFYSSFSPNVEVAMVVNTAMNGVSSIFAGFFVRSFSIPTYWKWLHYMSYMNWGTSGLIVNQFPTCNGTLPPRPPLGPVHPPTPHHNNHTHPNHTHTQPHALTDAGLGVAAGAFEDYFGLSSADGVDVAAASAAAVQQLTDDLAAGRALDGGARPAMGGGLPFPPGLAECVENGYILQLYYGWGHAGPDPWLCVGILLGITVLFYTLCYLMLRFLPSGN